MLNKTGGHLVAPWSFGIKSSLTCEGRCRGRRRTNCRWCSGSCRRYLGWTWFCLSILGVDRLREFGLVVVRVAKLVVVALVIVGVDGAFVREEGVMHGVFHFARRRRPARRSYPGDPPGPRPRRVARNEDNDRVRSEYRASRRPIIRSSCHVVIIRPPILYTGSPIIRQMKAASLPGPTKTDFSQLIYC